MNKIFLSLAMLASAMIRGMGHQYVVAINPRWHPIEHIRNDTDITWMLIGDITVRKKVPEICKLQRLVFKWEGERVRSLFGSLYLHEPKKGWMITPEHLIADSRWDAQKQELTFECSKPMHIGITTTIGLVLLVPTELETILKNGSFSLDASCLPEHMALSMSNKTLRLSWSSRPESMG